MSSHRPFDDQYWNLAQACAWVEYREQQMVNDFQDPDRNAYMAIGMYPSMWPTGRKRRGSIEELRRALEQGRIRSSGYRRRSPEELEDIPAAEWVDFVIRPPFVNFAGQPNNQPWNAVRVRSAEMKQLWRSVNEVEGRSKIDWVTIRTIYDEVKLQNPAMSQNELIIETQGAFEDLYKEKRAPSRTSLQTMIKTWS